ncbi:MAG TPA: class I SAM-dependent methyltransferase, partial [Candidatus Hydrogenedentes bacterium]|nr:class I SAM-dependent methyltransferase [Candidatus Hydrogenedentota bacterium]
MPHAAILKPKEERRLLRGHRWAYRNEFASLPDAQDGELVDVLADGGRFVGRGFFQASGGIAVRILTLEDKPIDGELLRARIHRARRYRDQLYGGSTVYRWVYAESDGLPALIADRYDCMVSVQAGSPFYAGHAEGIAEAIMESGDVRGVRFEAGGKALHFGEFLSPIDVSLNGIRFHVDVEQGQKTGMFLDQRENVRMLEPIVKGARVLDGHCYTGLWGVSAACWGAQEVIGFDTSAPAIEMAAENARLNRVEARCSFKCADVQTALHEKKHYDVVMLDPPDHTAFRRLVSRPMTPSRVQELGPVITRFVDDRLDRIASDGRTADIVELLLKPLPSMVVAHFIGVPEEDARICADVLITS